MRSFLNLIYLSPAVLLCACSGLAPGSSTAPSSGAQTTISGTLSAGPVHGATLVAYALNSDASKGIQLGTATSDSSGHYSLSMTSPTGAVLIVATGGTYTEEGSGATVSVGNAQIRTTLSAVSDGQKVGVTPLTEIATQTALDLIATNTSVSMNSIITSTNSKVATAMGLPDITIPPADPTVAAANATSVSAAQYAVVLASISQMAKTAAASNQVNSLDMMQALATSFTYNGNFNSKVGTTDIPVPNGTGSTISLNTVLGGASNFNSAMQTATTSVLATLPTGFDNTTVVPTVTYVTAPPAPSGAPTVVQPNPPTTLPSNRPTTSGPPAVPTPTLPTPTPTPTPIPVTPVAGVWHTAVQVGGSTADYGTLAYSPSGSARVGYSVINGSNTLYLPIYDLYTAAQATSTTFATPALVALGTTQSNRGGGIFGSYFYSSASTIWLSAESDYLMNIYKSTDSGATWTSSKIYAIVDSAPSYGHSNWVDLGSGNLANYFAYSFHSNVFGDGPVLAFANFTAGNWDTGLTERSAVTGDPRSVVRFGSTVLINQNAMLGTSTDSGITFTASGTIGAQEVLQIGSAVYSHDSTGLWKSTDSGVTWTKIYSGNLSGKMAGNSTYMVCVAGEGGQTMSYVASADGGLTWTAPVVLIDHSTTVPYTQFSSVQVSVSSTGHLGLVYSEQQAVSSNGVTGVGPGSIGLGVHFNEFY